TDDSTPQFEMPSPPFLPARDVPLIPEDHRERYARKKLNQWTRWRDSVIPELIPAYLTYVASTANRLDKSFDLVCKCDGQKRKLQVTVVYMDRLDKLEILICPCISAARRLMFLGLFPCAPQSPSLAFDLNMVELVSTLFANVAPNVTAWASTLESFLGARAYKLQTRDSLRRRFGNALQWYKYLVDCVQNKRDEVLATARKRVHDQLRSRHDRASLSEGETNPQESTPPDTGSASFHPSSDCTPPALKLTDGIPSERYSSCAPSDLPPTDHTSSDRTSSCTLSGRTSSNHASSDRASSRTPCDCTSSAHAPTRSTPSDKCRESPWNPASEKSFGQQKDDMPNETLDDRPSPYLQSRCLLCFGGRGDRIPSMSLDLIVCLDACFTQKRCAERRPSKEDGPKPYRPPGRPGKRDPVKTHPSSVFISECEVRAMEAEVDRRRQKTRPSRHSHDGDGESSGTSSSKRKYRSSSDHDEAPEEDRCEGPLRVPNSVLDGCEQSFKAADNQREKASTQFFEDTGLMALTCRHDQVLWLANMTSAGERQHYPLALLRKLFEHIPESWRVGVLYDIGCQLHRSCFKWGYLSKYRHRIAFGISVFHAYGHQWPCQVVYHPRKCIGFGLTDGESCERLWSALAHLVAVLRVSGYHQRLYALDSQLQHLSGLHRLSFGDWLIKKYNNCISRLSAAREELEDCGIDLAVLMHEWASQQVSQTKPLQRQRKNAADKDIDTVLNLDEVARGLEKKIKDLEGVIVSGHSDETTRVELGEYERRLGHVKTSASRYRARMDVQERAKLEKLRGNKFLNLRVNGLAMKTRLRDRLRQRKFELSRMDRMPPDEESERKLHVHVANAIHRREPNIQALARRYNTLCTEMDQLIRRGLAPPGAVAPTPLKASQLWTLDVDDPIWHDTGLVDEADDGKAIPRWLADENVRKGIRAMLEVDRCEEELVRLRKERTTLQEWLQDEWAALQGALVDHATNVGIRHQLHMYREELLRLAVTWRRRCGDMEGIRNWEPSWGPTDDEM
ncbi:hypothetical protein PUNSTDRAFT_35949, partial [Punctularia strigosozonata HHB-11173 SS5]